MFKPGDILKLNKLGLEHCNGEPDFRLKFIIGTSSNNFDGEYINGMRKGLKDTYFNLGYYELADRKTPFNNIELLDHLKQNEESYYG